MRFDNKALKGMSLADLHLYAGKAELAQGNGPAFSQILENRIARLEKEIKRREQPDYTPDEHEAYLNDLYTDGMQHEAVFDQFIYLTNKSRGKHISEKTLRAAISNGTMGTVLRKYDPIAFNTSMRDV